MLEAYECVAVEAAQRPRGGRRRCASATSTWSSWTARCRCSTASRRPPRSAGWSGRRAPPRADRRPHGLGAQGRARALPRGRHGRLPVQAGPPGASSARRCAAGSAPERAASSESAAVTFDLVGTGNGAARRTAPAATIGQRRARPVASSTPSARCRSTRAGRHPEPPRRHLPRAHARSRSGAPGRGGRRPVRRGAADRAHHQVEHRHAGRHRAGPPAERRGGGRPGRSARRRSPGSSTQIEAEYERSIAP